LNVADKYNDVLALEASVAELHQMFLDFALLTEQQVAISLKSPLDTLDNSLDDRIAIITPLHILLQLP
jgi:hypothetical protein